MSFFTASQLKSFQSIGKFEKKIIMRKPQKLHLGLIGLQLSMKGSLIFQGHLRMFNIQFKPIGF